MFQRVKTAVRVQMGWLMGEGATERDRMRSAMQAQVQLLRLRKDEAAQAMAQVVVCRERLRSRLAHRAAFSDQIQEHLAADRYDLAREELLQAGLIQDVETGKLMSRLDDAQQAAGRKIAAYREAEAELERMQAEYQDSIWLERAEQIQQQYENSLFELTERLSPRAAFDRAVDQTMRASELRKAREEVVTDFAAALETEIQYVLAQSPAAGSNAPASLESPMTAPVAGQVEPPVVAEEQQAPDSQNGRTMASQAPGSANATLREPETVAEEEPEWVRESRAPEEDVG